MYTLEHGLEIHNTIKNSQFCVIPNCSHEVFSEKPEIITKIAIDFLNGK
jgi:pimeloyl-ACP methyl ester carboxylesterase